LEEEQRMEKRPVGIIHPGNMGVSVAASVKNGGHDVLWAAEGRSAQTHQRAAEADLREVASLAELCQTCAVLLSVCPPHAAEEVADRVLALGYDGLYLDANAISPERVRRIGLKMEAGGVSFVDGGIVGGPAWEPGETWLYLAGRQASEMASFFAAGPLEISVLGPDIGRASALKMCYAAWTKGSTGLLCAIVAAAQELGVWQDLRVQWERDWPGFAENTTGRVRRVTAKAWRFAGEMEEISATLESAGVPGDFHLGAAEIYHRMAGFKDAPSIPPLAAVVGALVRTAP
jgi:3-hydroxyisobutyrate dehydrogenase-like beta-hydroxyacid dehydrogenase